MSLPARYRPRSSSAAGTTPTTSGTPVPNTLVARGLLTAAGDLTEAGRALKDHVEERTDTLALTALAALDDAAVETLFAALTPLTRAVVAGGDIPAATPMGLRRDDLDDDSAHL